MEKYFDAAMCRQLAFTAILRENGFDSPGPSAEGRHSIWNVLEWALNHPSEGSMLHFFSELERAVEQLAAYMEPYSRPVAGSSYQDGEEHA